MVLDIKNGLDIQYLAKDGFCLLPWWTRKALDVLEEMDLSDKKVFEYSSGISSIYFAHKAKYLCAVEHDNSWRQNIYDTLKEHSLLSNTFIQIEPNAEYYIKSVEAGSRPDMVIIDGIHREETFWKSINVLEKGGVLVYDNWMQPSVEMQSEAVQNEVKKYKHEVYPQQGRDWQTLILWK